MANFNGIDYVVIVLLVLSTGMGIFRGFVKEIISLISWIAAFTVATLYSVQFAALFTSSASHAPGANPADSVSTLAIIISYLVLFAGVLILGSIIKFIVNYAVEGGGISLTNRLLGSLLGLARGCVVVLLIMFFVSFTALASGMLWKESVMVKLFNPAVKWVNEKAQPYLSVIEAKMKKAAKGANEDEMTDVIKVKPATVTAPVIVPPSQTVVSPVVPAPAPTPAVVPAAPATKAGLK